MQSKILHYMRQMAVITPYAQFLFRFVSEASEYVIYSFFFNLHLSLFIVVALSFTQQNSGSQAVPQGQPNQTLDEYFVIFQNLFLFFLQ